MEEVVSRVDVHESTAVRVLNAMNEGFGSLQEVDFPAYGVARPSTLVSLSLHSNWVSSLEGFESMTVSMFFCTYVPSCFCSSQQQRQQQQRQQQQQQRQERQEQQQQLCCLQNSSSSSSSLSCSCCCSFICVRSRVCVRSIDASGQQCDRSTDASREQEPSSALLYIGKGARWFARFGCGLRYFMKNLLLFFLQPLDFMVVRV